MIDAQLRAKGVGGSDIAALVGLDPRRDAFAVYADKLDLVEREEPTPRMRMGKRLEKVIAAAYAEESGQAVAWFDTTMHHDERPWQIFSVDAFVIQSHLVPAGEMYTITTGGVKNLQPIGILDAKNVALDQYTLWGDAGTDQVPDWIACQAQWYCSGTGLPWCDIAALFGGNDLRIYRVNADREIEETLLEVAERFWTENILAQVPPPIGHSETAARYLKQRFPRNVQNLRRATPDEVMLMSRYKNERAVRDEAIARCKDVENELKRVIAEADGLDDPILGKVTHKFVKDLVGPDWESIARAIIEDLKLGAFPAREFPRIEDYTELHQHVIRQGFRRLNVPRTWKTTGEEE